MSSLSALPVSPSPSRWHVQAAPGLMRHPHPLPCALCQTLCAPCHTQGRVRKGRARGPGKGALTAWV